MGENEKQLVRSLSAGNILAFNTLFNCYSGRLYRFAYGYLKSESESEELVQDVFTKIWEKRKNLKEELSFRSYLFTIAFNNIRKHFRRKSYLEEYVRSGFREDIDMQTVHTVNFDSLADYVEELVQKLPNRRREIFIKSRFEGSSIGDIARDLNLSHKTVENQITEALKFLRTNLGQENIQAMLFLSLFFS